MAAFPKAPSDERAAEVGAIAEPCAQRDEPWILAATILGSSIVFIDGTVVSVALPVLQLDLGANVAGVQWVVEAYSLALAALILVGGSLGDRFGRRRVFAVGVGLFAGSSVMCGLAPNVQWLIFARAAQGVGGALLAPNSLAIISAAFDEDRRGRAIGTWSAFTAMTTAVGPVLGGFFVEHLSWRWVFLINVPLAVVTVAIALWRVPESRDDSAPPSIDWRGAMLATLGLGSIVYGLTEATNLGLDHPAVIAAVIAGAVALVLFGVVEARTRYPMLPLTLFQSQNFTVANLLTFLLYAGLSGSLFLVPFNLIQVQGYSTTAAGASMLPFVLMIFVLSRWTGGLVDRVGPKVPLVAGPLIFAGATALYALPGLDGHNYWTSFFPIILLQGLGMAIAVAPLTTVVMSSVPSSHAGIAAGVNNAVSRTGGLLAVAIVGVLALTAFGGELQRQLSVMSLPAEIVQAIQAQVTKLGAIEIPPGLAAHVAATLRRAIDVSFLTAFRVTELAAATLALAAGLSALALERRRRTNGVG